MNSRTEADQILARYRQYGWEYHQTQGAGSQFGDLEWFRQIARANPGPILDLGCGSGRVLLPLRDEGLPVIGLDGSRSLLALCRAQVAPSEKAALTLVQADFRRLCFRRHFFATAIIAGNTLPMMTEDTRRCLLSEVKEVLRPGGVLAVTVRRFDLCRFKDGRPVTHHREPLLDETSGCWVTRSTELHYVPETSRIVAHISFRCLLPEGKTEDHAYEIAYVADYADRIADEAQASGFVLEGAYPGYGQTDANGLAGEMIGITLRPRIAAR